MSEALEVWLDAAFINDRLRVGTLAHNRGAVRFSYDPAWLKHPLSFAVDPDLSLGEGACHPTPELGNFRVFDRSRMQLLSRLKTLDLFRQGFSISAESD